MLSELASSIFINMRERFLDIAEQSPAGDARYTAALIDVMQEVLITHAELNGAILAQTAVSPELQQQLSAFIKQ